MVTRARDAPPLGHDIEHTADLGFEVEAPTLEGLFERAGLALAGLMVDLAAVDPGERVPIAVAADGLEELLHDWLQALLVRFQVEGFAACELAVEAVDARAVRGVAGGERVDPRRHHLRAEVKGVTYHQLAVVRSQDGWRARVILDV